MHNHRINFDQRTQLRIALENIDVAEKIKAIPIPIRYNVRQSDGLSSLKVIGPN